MKKLFAFVLTLCMIFSLCACGSQQDSNGPSGNEPIGNESSSAQVSSKEETAPKFEVTVTDAEGNAVKGVMVQLCKDSCVPAATDENGVAVFNFEITDGYKLSVMSCPEGYEYTGEAEIYLEEGATEYTLEIQAKEEA